MNSNLFEALRSRGMDHDQLSELEAAMGTMGIEDLPQELLPGLNLPEELRTMTVTVGDEAVAGKNHWRTEQ